MQANKYLIFDLAHPLAIMLARWLPLGWWSPRENFRASCRGGFRFTSKWLFSSIWSFKPLPVANPGRPCCFESHIRIPMPGIVKLTLFSSRKSIKYSFKFAQTSVVIQCWKIWRGAFHPGYVPQQRWKSEISSHRSRDGRDCGKNRSWWQW